MIQSESLNESKFISLAKASEITGYHQDYLGFLARRGKLEAEKVGRNWITTLEALDKINLKPTPKNYQQFSTSSINPQLSTEALENLKREVIASITEKQNNFERKIENTLNTFQSNLYQDLNKLIDQKLSAVNLQTIKKPNSLPRGNIKKVLFSSKYFSISNVAIALLFFGISVSSYLSHTQAETIVRVDLVESVKNSGSLILPSTSVSKDFKVAYLQGEPGPQGPQGSVGPQGPENIIGSSKVLAQEYLGGSSLNQGTEYSGLASSDGVTVGGAATSIQQSSKNSFAFNNLDLKLVALSNTVPAASFNNKKDDSLIIAGRMENYNLYSMNTLSMNGVKIFGTNVGISAFQANVSKANDLFSQANLNPQSTVDTSKALMNSPSGKTATLTSTVSQYTNDQLSL